MFLYGCYGSESFIAATLLVWSLEMSFKTYGSILNFFFLINNQQSFYICMRKILTIWTSSLIEKMETQWLEKKKKKWDGEDGKDCAGHIEMWIMSCFSWRTRSWGSRWHPPLLSGCICPCTGACPGSWSGCFFLCSRWAPCQTSEVGTAPRDAETSGAEGGGGGRRKGHETHQAVHQSVWPISVHFPD